MTQPRSLLDRRCSSTGSGEGAPRRTLPGPPAAGRWGNPAATIATQRNATAERAIDILLLFQQSQPTLSANDIGLRLGMSRSTTYRYLQTLQQAELLERCAGNGQFRLGPQILRLATVARRCIGLSEVALPVLRQLARDTGETALLTRRFGQQVVCLELADARQTIRLPCERGQLLPPDAGAPALVLFAWDGVGDRAAPTGRPGFGSAGQPDGPLVRAELAVIRRTGVAVSVGELHPDVLTVAAPVRNAVHRVVAGVSVAALRHRTGAARQAEVVDAVRRAAELIGRELAERDGHRPVRPGEPGGRRWAGG